MNLPRQERIARMLRPRSIAVVGASTDRTKMAGRIIPLLQSSGFSGALYPVNPSYDSVAGLRSYPSLDGIASPIDHCIIVVRRELAEAALQTCAAKGIPGASVFSSGYGETGDEGKAAEARLRALAQDVSFLGPNCMGFANFVDRVVATSSPVFARHSESGDVGVVSQSGGLVFGSLAFLATEQGMRFSHVVNVGNAVGVQVADLYQFLCNDAATRVILFILESEALLAELVLAVAKFDRPKPVVLLKLGRGATGAAMASSHTGSLAGDYRLGKQCAQQEGIVCTEDLDGAVGVLQLLRAGFGPTQGDAVAVASISGGNATLAADAIDASSMQFAQFSDATRQALRSLLPGYVGVSNPVDMTGAAFEDVSVHLRVLRALRDDSSVDCVVPVLVTANDYRNVCSGFAEIAAETPARLAVVWNGGSYDGEAGAILQQASIPVFRSASSLAAAFDALRAAGGNLLQKAKPPVSHDGPTPDARLPLPEAEAMAFLQRNSIPVARSRVCLRKDREAVLRAAGEIGYPLVIKADSADTGISDQGAVVLDIRSDSELQVALDNFPDIGDRLLVMEFLKGIELFVSAFEHPSFGKVLTVGTGGRFVELIRDVQFVRLPANRHQLRKALATTMAGQGLAAGFRQLSGFEAALDLLSALAGVFSDASDVAQIEMNPVLVGSHGAAAVDAVVVLKQA